MVKEQGELWGAKVPVKHSGKTNTIAVGNLLTQQPAGLPFIPQSSKKLAPELIAMPMMMQPALSLARPLIISSFSAPILNLKGMANNTRESCRENRREGGFTPPFNDDGTEGKVQIVSSSSNTLLFPLPILTLLLVANMFF
ncbi:hypothetical protein V6N13_054749 [Hibiscus sabdariffa]